MMLKSIQRLFRDPESFLIVALFLLLVIQLGFSLTWKFVHDGPLLQYVAFLILEDNRIPYLDIFDVNLPGTHFFFIFWIKLFGYSDFGFRILDILWLSGILVLLFFILKRFGRIAAWYGVVLVGLSYVSFMPLSSLQREWIIALPFLIATLLILSESKYHNLRLFLVGILGGVCFTIKPHSLIGWLPLLIFAVIFNGSGVVRLKNLKVILRIAKQLILIGIGFLLIPGALVIWLKSAGALDDFLEIAKNYYPLFSQISGGHEIVTGYKRLLYLAEDTLRFGVNGTWLIAALFTGYFLIINVRLESQEKRQFGLLVALCLVFAVYPAITGQFWGYHWTFFQILIITLYSVTTYHHRLPTGTNYRYFRIVLTIMALLTGPRPPISPDFVYQLTHGEPKPAKYGRVVEIEHFLEDNLKPGDTVQPLDWTGGAVHGMLRAKARLATSFLCDVSFYHHVDNPYIQRLRARFIDELKKSRPIFVIEVIADDKPFLSGPGTSYVFPELRNYLIENYTVFVEKNGYIIYRQKDTAMGSVPEASSSP
jgi:hypothetical protein